MTAVKLITYNYKSLANKGTQVNNNKRVWKYSLVYLAHALLIIYGCSELELALSSKAGTELFGFLFTDQTKE